jgi:myo-inositol 2-dehydrogenase / D-chiro-inositol 1-dehydrogenase
MTKAIKSISRRDFFGNAAAISAVGAVGMGYLLNSCSSESNKMPPGIPPLLDQAPDGPVLRAGLVGCGNRGTGAAIDFLSAGPNLQLVAITDTFQDRMDACRQKLKEAKGVELPDEMCFLGLDGYQKVIDAGVDIVLLVTPPYFRPEHFKACVDARKHVFMEKPVAVDPVGARSIMASGKRAETLGLTVITGTQRRHQHDYIETYKRIYNGAIGDLVAANCYWNQAKLWHRERLPEWSDMEFMIRDWVNWSWLSGDHIVEQHVHNIDVINWFTGKYPVKAVGFGSRHRRVTGDQYDNFSVDFEYDNGVHLHSMCRQINDCENNVSEYIRGTKGYTNCKDVIYNSDGTVQWAFEYPKGEDGKPDPKNQRRAYQQEHVDMITAIRTNTPVNEAEANASSTLAGIMGRISAYTGKAVTWEEMMGSDLQLGPKDISLGNVDMKFTIPVPGSAPA